MRVLVTGGGGQLAVDLVRTFADCDVQALSRRNFDITDVAQVERELRARGPDVLINTAAYHAVDRCESEPEQSFLVNAAAPQRLAATCRSLGIRFVHFSTDYVFDGAAVVPYGEDHPVAPLSVYGCSKAAGEMAIRSTMDDHLIVRTTGLFGTGGLTSGHGNFVETMLRLGNTREVTTVVSDQVLTPSSTADVARYTRLLLARGARGTVHVTNSGQCSWYEFAAEIFRMARLSGRLEPIPQARYQAAARRPAWSVLDHGTMRGLGLPEPRSWREALDEYVEQRSSLLAAAGLGSRGPCEGEGHDSDGENGVGV